MPPLPPRSFGDIVRLGDWACCPNLGEKPHDHSESNDYGDTCPQCHPLHGKCVPR